MKSLDPSVQEWVSFFYFVVDFQVVNKENFNPEWMHVKMIGKSITIAH
ncbi:MAG: hypothetical protein ACTSVI_15220 [Promethearchaeota archaeon]